MTDRSTTAGPRRAARIALAMAMFCLAFGCPSLEASILAPTSDAEIGADFGAPLTADQLDAALDKLAKADASMAAGSSAPRRTAPAQPAGFPAEESPAPGKADLKHFATLGPDAGNTGGSTSSSSTSAGASSSAGLAPLAATAPLLADDAPVERYAAERSLFLPEAPGTELLRPPRG
jgi:hypothetical protein